MRNVIGNDEDIIIKNNLNFLNLYKSSLPHGGGVNFTNKIKTNNWI